MCIPYSIILLAWGRGGSLEAPSAAPQLRLDNRVDDIENGLDLYDSGRQA